MLTWDHDIRNASRWFGWHYREGHGLMITLSEPPVAKPRSFKATARVNALLHGTETLAVTGKINVYFSAFSSSSPPPYGTQIILHTKPEPIRNRGNPGEFDYALYSLRRGITHQVFLKEGEFRTLPGKSSNQLEEIIFSARRRVLSALRTYLPEGPELGVAEALLIGYRDDLDRELLQRYANTGVVHIIAISGLHLGLIYWMLRFLLRPLNSWRNAKWLPVVLTLTGLWGFSLLAGAQPSILRAAVMFSCVMLGETFSKNSSVYNSIACSAFLLLCHYPFWLWDIGFQLSYAAVLSIVIFIKPVYHLLFFQNRILDGIWKLNAVTLAAQILSFPICTYYFHQFPNYFLLANLLAVPLSTLILFAEILLCFLHFSEPVATVLGDCISWMIGRMNDYISAIDSLPSATWNGLQLSGLQTGLLYLLIASSYIWLRSRLRAILIVSLSLLVLFIASRSYFFLTAQSQRKIIIYHLPGGEAIDLVTGRSCHLADRKKVVGAELYRRFIEPCRRKYRARQSESVLGLQHRGNLTEFAGKKIIHLEGPVRIIDSISCGVDVVLISGNRKIVLAELARFTRIRLLVIGNSVRQQTASEMKEEARRLGMSCHDMRESGALVIEF